jgi:predicted nucleic acid-binding protein
VVCDAGPLIHLDEVGCLDLLRLFEKVLVPDLVWEEVDRYRPSALRRKHVTLIRVQDPSSASDELADLIAAYALDAGEEHALRLMEAHPQGVLLTDDMAAREVATRRGFQVRGSLGVLLSGWEAGCRTRRQLLNILTKLPTASSLFVTKSFLRKLIDRVQGTNP